MTLLLLVKIGFPELVLIGFFVIIPLLLIIFSLRDLLKAQFVNKNEKIVWLLLVLLIPVLGALLYLLIGSGRKAGSTVRPDNQ